MHKTVEEAEELIAALLPRVSSVQRTEVAICPPFTALQAMVDSTRGSRVAVYAQNMHQAPDGAFTGEVSAPMLSEVGVRASCSATPSAASCSARPTRRWRSRCRPRSRPVCCRSCASARPRTSASAGDTERKLRHQVQEDLARLETEQLGEVVIAYEPIWAIGTGRVATPEQAQEAIAFVRALVGDRSPEQALRTRILYGGSVKPDNAAELLALPDVDGALVGGASLDAESFAAIVAAAE